MPTFTNASISKAFHVSASLPPKIKLEKLFGLPASPHFWNAGFYNRLAKRWPLKKCDGFYFSLFCWSWLAALRFRLIDFVLRDGRSGVAYWRGELAGMRLTTLIFSSIISIGSGTLNPAWSASREFVVETSFESGQTPLSSYRLRVQEGQSTSISTFSEDHLAHTDLKISAQKILETAPGEEEVTLKLKGLSKVTLYRRKLPILIVV